MRPFRGRARLTLVSFALLMAQGCGRSSNLGAPCVLSRGGDPIDTAALAQQKDFILFGAADCDELVCLRDRSSAGDAGIEAGRPVWGYCSVSCVPNGSACSQGEDLHCRAVLVDQDTLAGPGAQSLPASPYFCVRGGGDAGAP